MRRIFIATLSAAILFVSQAWASDVSIGVNADDDGLREFHLAIGNYFKMPETEITMVRERKIPDEEMPVVFYLAQKARVAPSVIVDLRLGGRSWLDIAHYHGLTTEIFYVETRAIDEPPYGRAIGYFKAKPRKEWKYIRLADDDVVNLVNLKFISSYSGHSPNDVIKMRSGGANFMKINREIKNYKPDKNDQDNDKQSKKQSKKSDSKGKKKGK